MAMEKNFNSNDVVIISDPIEDRNMYPEGYRYMLGETIYTVIKAFRADNTEMRRLLTSQGDVEEVTVATIKRDAHQSSPLTGHNSFFRELEPKESITEE